MVERKGHSEDREDREESNRLSTRDLHTILEVNKRSIEINLGVERQMEAFEKDLERCNDKIDDLDKKVDDLDTKMSSIDKNIFKLVVILSGLGIGTVIELIKIFSGH